LVLLPFQRTLLPLIYKSNCQDYNKKPHYALFGLTPVEVFYGKLPDKQLRHKQIANARAQRLLKNSNFDCNDCEQIDE